MDTDKLKNRIREALGGAGIPRDITEQIDRIIDQEAGKKGEERPKLATRARAAVDDDDEEDEDESPRRTASTTASARKMVVRKKK